MLTIAKPVILPLLYPSLTWKIKTRQKEVFLTFDDGPTPEVTPWVLEQLKKYDAKATFFCIGKNVEKYPEIYDSILREGHRVGNHTHNHKRGWTTSNLDYVQNVNHASKHINSELFRPPYGMIKTSQLLQLRDKYKIIMWNVLTRDYNRDLSPSTCLENVKKYTRPGSIIVFHDSKKAQNNLNYALPRALDYLKQEGYTMNTIQ